MQYYYCLSLLADNPQTDRSYFTCLGPAAAAVGVVTWLASVAMVARVELGVAREALAAVTAPPAKVVTLPVTVPRLDSPAKTKTQTHTDLRHKHTCETDAVFLKV